MIKRLFLLLFFWVKLSYSTDMIIFSFDRAMQLYAFLESVEKYIKGLNEVHVIYRTSGQQYDIAYSEVEKRFKTLNLFMLKQNEKNFRELTLRTINLCKSPYLIFAVDDIIVKDNIDFNEMINVINDLNTKLPIKGFYLRLGKNITQCYAKTNNNTPPPSSLREIKKDVYLWKFSEGKGDWRYPNTVDMTLFKRDVVINEVSNLNFHSPNTFEGEWAAKYSNLSQYGLCYEFSKVVNIPANRVQLDFNAHNMGSFSKEELLEKFNNGLKIDIYKFYRINNFSPHHEQEYLFINR